MQSRPSLPTRPPRIIIYEGQGLTLGHYRGPGGSRKGHAKIGWNLAIPLFGNAVLTLITPDSNRALRGCMGMCVA